MKKVLLCGYYGFGNQGDEALLSSMVKILSDYDLELEVEALSYNVKYTEKIQGVNGFSRKSILKLIHKIFCVDYIIFGGGSLLQDTTSSKSLLYYMGIMFISKIFGKKVAIIANGFGAIRSKLNRFLVKIVLSMVDLISVRDSKSLETMREIGIKRKVHLTADITFLMEDMSIPKFNRKKAIGISLRKWQFSDDFLFQISSFADEMYRRGYEIRFYPMKQLDDVKVCKEVTRLMKNPAIVFDDIESPTQMIFSMRDCFAFVSVRLHGLIFATNLGIPSIAIDYDPKIGGFVSESSVYNAGKINDITSKNLVQALNYIEDNIDDMIHKTFKDREKFKARANFDRQLILDLLNE